MQSCRDMELMLHDYLEGYLLPSQREVLEEHVRDCDSCRSLLVELRQLDDEFVDFPAVEAPADLSGRILGSIPPLETPAFRRPYRAGTFRPALAALAVIAIGLFIGTHYSGIERADGVREIEIAFFAPAAGSVAVVGDFNDWDTRQHRMERAGKEGFWRVKLRLRQGVYEYGFLIDGSDWSKDPRAEKFLADGFGGENSVLYVGG